MRVMVVGSVVLISHCSPAVATQLQERLNKTFILEKTLLSCRQLEENTLVFACMWLEPCFTY